MDNQDNIELRSEKIRHIIGRIPPALIRSGIGVISGIIFLLILAAFFIPYPETVEASVQAEDVDNGYTGEAKAAIPYDNFSEIKPGMKVKIHFEGYPPDTYGYVEGVIKRVYRDLIDDGSTGFFMADVTFIQPGGYYIVMKKQFGTGFICISNLTLAQRIFPALATSP